MDIMIVILRLLHVVLGVFWAGTIFFFAMFLFPTLGDMGPDAGKFMGALTKRRYPDIMPVIAGITILSGFLLYYRMSNGFDPAYMGSRYGMGYGNGGVTATLALIIGVAMLRPAANRMGKLMQSMPSAAAGPERDQMMAEVTRLRQRLATGSMIVTFLLLVTVILMAVTRYL